MSLVELRWLARVHGVIAWGATAAVLLAAVLALASARRAAGRGVVAASAGAVALLSAAAAAGLALDLPYRGRLRQRVFLDDAYAHAPSLGWLFERKLHLAFGATALAWCALALLGAAALARRRALEVGHIADVRDGAAGQALPWVADLERGGRMALAASAALALGAAIISAVVARRYSF